MFNSIVEAPPAWKVGNLTSGTGLSILAHLTVLLGAIILQNQAPKEVEPPAPVLHLYKARPPKGNPVPVASTTPPTPPKPKKRALTAPTTIRPLPVDPPLAPEVASLDPPVAGLPFIEGSDPNGIEHGGVPHATGTSGNGDGNREDLVVFGEGMTRPELISGRDIQYTREAREAQVEGTLIARCTITREGEIRDCRVIKPLPFMTEAVVAALHTRKYTPVTFQGQPVTVTYVFNVRLRMP